MAVRAYDTTCAARGLANDLNEKPYEPFCVRPYIGRHVHRRSAPQQCGVRYRGTTVFKCRRYGTNPAY